MGALASTDKQINIEAWKQLPTDALKPSDFPEFDRPELNAKPNVAVCFSGKGAHAAAMGLGALAGLRDVGLLDKIRYLGGMNGGMWATILYIYSQLSDNDNVFLGPVIQPEKITKDNIRNINELCVRKVLSNNFIPDPIGGWKGAIAEKLLRQSGIHPYKPFSWDEPTVEDILLRNPGLGFKQDDFLLPRKYNAPFMVLGWSQLGPVPGLIDSFYQIPYDLNIFEITPLYLGQMKTSVIARGDKQITVGGYIEPYGFPTSGGIAPTKGLSKTETNGFIPVPKPKRLIDFSTVAGTGTFIPQLNDGAIMDMTSPYQVYDYFSVADVNPTVTPTVYPDGNNTQNSPIIPFLQRGVERIINFFATENSIDFDGLLNTNDPNSWKRKKIIADDQFDPTIAALFGISPLGINGQCIYPDIKKTQVFKTEEFEDLIIGLKQSYDRGIGTFFRKSFTTVFNANYGIAGAKKVDVTFYCMTKLLVWESRLDPVIRDAISKPVVLPQQKTCVQTVQLNGVPVVPIPVPEFQGYPHFGNPNKTQFTKAEINLICDQMGWSIFYNRDFFGSVLKK